MPPPPHPCNVTARTILNLGHSRYTDLPLFPPPHPVFLLAGAAAHYPRPAFLLAGAAANYGSLCGHVFVRWRERGGAWYYITTSRMAEGCKDPCTSHIDASHGEGPRIESSLLFCIFFYIVKIIEKSLFYEQEIGFTRK